MPLVRATATVSCGIEDAVKSFGLQGTKGEERKVMRYATARGIDCSVAITVERVVVEESPMSANQP
jgi:hypothetical protein